MHRSLIVLPDDTGQPLVDAIAAARQSLRIKMFLFSDPGLIAAVIAAQQRGVKVRVMLNPARRSGEGENQATRKTLEDAGVEVVDSNPAFDITHEKSLVVDDETAFVHSLNWETKNLTETRDYAVVTSHRHEVDEIVQCFDADWNREPFDPGDDAHLIWCNINGRNRVARFIDSAEESLFLQNERYQDEVIIERLVRAHTPRREAACAGPPDALSQGGQAGRGRRRPAHSPGSWGQGAPAEGTQAARQDVAG
jgi:cardiolipin synthase